MATRVSIYALGCLVLVIFVRAETAFFVGSTFLCHMVVFMQPRPGLIVPVARYSRGGCYPCDFGINLCFSRVNAVAAFFAWSTFTVAVCLVELGVVIWKKRSVCLCFQLAKDHIGRCPRQREANVHYHSRLWPLIIPCARSEPFTYLLCIAV